MGKRWDIYTLPSYTSIKPSPSTHKNTPKVEDFQTHNTHTRLESQSGKYIMVIKNQKMIVSI